MKKLLNQLYHIVAKKETQLNRVTVREFSRSRQAVLNRLVSRSPPREIEGCLMGLAIYL